MEDNAWSMEDILYTIYYTLNTKHYTPTIYYTLLKLILKVFRGEFCYGSALMERL